MKNTLLILLLIITTAYCLPQSVKIPKEREVRFILKDSTVINKDYNHSSKRLGVISTDILNYDKYVNMRGEILQVMIIISILENKKLSLYTENKEINYWGHSSVW